MTERRAYVREVPLQVETVCARCAQPFTYLHRTNTKKYCPECKPLRNRETLRAGRKVKWRKQRTRLIAKLVPVADIAMFSRRKGNLEVYKDPATGALYRKDSRTRYTKICARVLRAVLGLALLFALPRQAPATEVVRPPAELTMVLQPPWRFSHPYRGRVTEYRMFVDAARMLCKRQGAEADSCSWVEKGRCFIVVPWDAPVRDPEQYRRHEIAHCNGWGAGHEK